MFTTDFFTQNESYAVNGSITPKHLPSKRESREYETKLHLWGSNCEDQGNGEYLFVAISYMSTLTRS